MNQEMIAPCGMNCSVCLAHLREKNRCPGCRFVTKDGPTTRVNCKIKNCEVIKKNGWTFCSTKCKEFPCQKMQSLDKRYRTKYGISQIKNLNNIEKNGTRKFLESEEKRWIHGDKVMCVHDGKYYPIN